MYEREVLLNLGKERMTHEKSLEFTKRKFLRNQLRRNHILAKQFIRDFEKKLQTNSAKNDNGALNSNENEQMIKNIIAEYQNEHHGREDDSTRHKRLLREMEENNYKKNIESKRKILDEMKNEQMTDDARKIGRAHV